MFLSEWHEFPSALCLTGKQTCWQLASPCCWNRARPWHAFKLVSFLVGPRTYQHSDILYVCIKGINTVCCLHIKYLLTTLGAFTKLRKTTIICAGLFVCPSEWNNSAPTRRIFMKSCFRVFLNLWRKFKVHYNLTRIIGTLSEDQCTFMTLSRWIPLRRNISEVV